MDSQWPVMMTISAKQAVAPAKGAGGDRGSTLGETWWWRLIGWYTAPNRSILAYLQKILLQGVIKSFRRGLHSVDCCCVQQIYSSCEKLRQKHMVACNVWNARILRRSGKLTVPSFLDWSLNGSPLFFLVGRKHPEILKQQSHLATHGFMERIFSTARWFTWPNSSQG